MWERAISNLDRVEKKKSKRVKRHVIYEPVYVKCVCNSKDDQCVPQRNDQDVYIQCWSKFYVYTTFLT